MKIMALRILINPVSEAGHVVLRSIGRPARRTPGQHAQQAHLISPLIRHASETAVAQRQLVRSRMGPTTLGQTTSLIRFRLCSPPGQAGQGRSLRSRRQGDGARRVPRAPVGYCSAIRSLLGADSEFFEKRGPSRASAISGRVGSS